MRWLSFLLLASCSGPPTVTLAVAPDPSVDIESLSRLRLVVRACDSNQPALAENVPLRSATPRLEAPVVPGTTFYAWLQGWEPCTPPCVPEGEADAGECTCVGDEVPAAQELTSEGCTEWIVIESDVQRTLPLDPLNLAARLCPPEPLSPSDCRTP